MIITEVKIKPKPAHNSNVFDSWFFTLKSIKTPPPKPRKSVNIPNTILSNSMPKVSGVNIPETNAADAIKQMYLPTVENLSLIHI